MSPEESRLEIARLQAKVSELEAIIAALEARLAVPIKCFLVARELGRRCEGA